MKRAPRRSVATLLRRTVSEWLDDDCERLAAALAFYTVWSVGPLFVIVVSVAGLAFGNEAAQTQLLSVVRDLVGPDAAQSVGETIGHARASGHTLLANVVGAILLLVSASGVFAELKSSLNVIWGVTPKPGSIWTTLRQRFWSVTVVLGTGFLLLVSLVVDAALAALGKQLEARVAAIVVLSHALHFLLSFAITSVLFTLMFKVIPDAKIAWRDASIGGAATAFLFDIGQQLIGLYLGRTSIGSAYGAASSLMIVVVWIYFSSCILFLGAQLTRVYADMYGTKIRPAEDAIRVPEGMTAAGAAERAKADQLKSGGRTEGAKEDSSREPTPALR